MKSLAKLVLLLAIVIAVPGCGCFTKERRNEPACVVLHQIIDCTTDVVMGSLGPAVLAMIKTYVGDMSQTPNWDGLIDALAIAGIKDGGCIIAQLQADFIGKPGADPMHMARVKSAHDAFEAYKVKHGIAGVKYKVKTPGGGTVLL